MSISAICESVSTINRLTLVSGPACVGKTTFLEQLSREPAYELKQLVGEKPLWVSCANELQSLFHTAQSPYLVPCLFESKTGHLFVTYDHNMVWINARGSYDNEPDLPSLLTRQKTTIITMWETPSILRNRCEQRIKDFKSNILRLSAVRKSAYRLRLHFKMRRLYGRSSEMWDQYLKWFALCESVGVSTHLTIRSSEPESIEEWHHLTEPLWKKESVA